MTNNPFINLPVATIVLNIEALRHQCFVGNPIYQSLWDVLWEAFMALEPDVHKRVIHMHDAEETIRVALGISPEDYYYCEEEFSV